MKHSIYFRDVSTLYLNHFQSYSNRIDSILSNRIYYILSILSNKSYSNRIDSIDSWFYLNKIENDLSIKSKRF